MAAKRAYYEKNLKKPGHYDGYGAIDQFHYHSWFGYLRPIPQEPLGRPLLFDALLQERNFNQSAPNYHGVYYTKEEVKKITFDHDAVLNQISDKYGFKNFINISSFCNISFSDWMNLTSYAKNALIYDFNDIQEHRAKEMREKETAQKLELKQSMLQQNKKFNGDYRNISIFK